jgi:hypothetical protein
MAEKVTLIEVDIDIDAAVKGSKSLAEEVAVLKSQTKKAKEEQGEFSKEYIQYNAALKSAQKEQRVQNNLIEKSISANIAAKGSIDQLRNQLAVVSVQWSKLSKEERENTEEGQLLTKQKLELTEALKAEEKATGDSRRNVGNYTEGLNDAVDATSQFIPVAGQATSAAKSLGVALKVMLGPIGLVIAAIALIAKGLQAFFTSSEEGQNKLRKLQAVFQTVFGNFNDVLSSIGEKIVAVFENPKQALKDFAGALKRNIINRFRGLLELIPNLGKAIGKLFKGEFKEAGKIAADAVAKVTLGVEDFTDKAINGFNKAKEALGEFIAEQEREIDIAQKLADQQANLDKQVRESLVLEAQDRLKLEQLKNQVELKNQTTAEERIKLLEEEDEILDSILQRNLDIAQQKLEIQKAQNALSNSTKEDLQAEAELQAEIFNIQSQLESQRREAITKRQEAEREIIAEEKARVDEAVALLEEEIERKNELLEEEKQRKIEQELTDFENEFAIAEGNLFAELELERQFLEKKREQEIQLAQKTGADVAKINAKFSKAQRALDIAELQAKISLAQGFTANLAQIAGEQTAIGKAAAVASATVSAIQGAISSYTSLASIPVVGPVLGAVAAAAALAAGYAQVKDILSVKSGLPGDSGVSASVPSASPPNIPSVPAVQPENVNPEIGAGIVTRGADDPTTQAVSAGVSNALEENPLQPVLVEDDVTVAQDDTIENNETVVI